jgi:hypothetical protein
LTTNGFRIVTLRSQAGRRSPEVIGILVQAGTISSSGDPQDLGAERAIQRQVPRQRIGDRVAGERRREQQGAIRERSVRVVEDNLRSLPR